MLAQSTSISPRLLGYCLIIAPLLFGASTFLWENGEYGVTGGTILALSTVFWIPALLGLFGFFKNTMPLYTSIGFLLAVYGCISGVSFAIVGIFSEAFGISHETYLSTAAEHSLAFNLLLFWPGPLFPLSFLVLGVNLLRRKIVPGWTGILLCLAGIAFPLSRIPRIEAIAHVADFLLLVPLAYIAKRYFLD
jgi:hypothetical protein